MTLRCTEGLPWQFCNFTCEITNWRWNFAPKLRSNSSPMYYICYWPGLELKSYTVSWVRFNLIYNHHQEIVFQFCPSENAESSSSPFTKDFHREERLQLLWFKREAQQLDPVVKYLFTAFYLFLLYSSTDEIPGFFLLLKNHIFIACSEDTIFIFHVWGYWCRHGY